MTPLADARRAGLLALLTLPVLATACATPPGADASPDAAGPVPGDSDADAGPRPVSGAPAATDDATPAALPASGWREGTQAAVTNAGTYRVHYRPVGGDIERGAPFGLEVWVLDARNETPRRDVTLTADAAMPEHEHGMNRVPRVTPDGPSPTGAFEVEGMLFHMLGRWELYLDVTRGAVTERAQFEVRLE